MANSKIQDYNFIINLNSLRAFVFLSVA